MFQGSRPAAEADDAAGARRGTRALARGAQGAALDRLRSLSGHPPACRAGQFSCPQAKIPMQPLWQGVQPEVRTPAARPGSPTPPAGLLVQGGLPQMTSTDDTAHDLFLEIFGVCNLDKAGSSVTLHIM